MPQLGALRRTVLKRYREAFQDFDVDVVPEVVDIPVHRLGWWLQEHDAELVAAAVLPFEGNHQDTTIIIAARPRASVDLG